MPDVRSAPPVLVRRLDPAELDALLALSVDRGWPAERDKWRFLLDVGEVYGVDAPDGDGLAGCVVATRYGDRLMAVGMMVVAARYNRQGLGRRLMTHAMAASPGETVALFATDLGRPLYTSLGFRAIGSCHRYVSPGWAAEPDRPASSRPVRPEDLPALYALDGEVFGAPRAAVLDRLPAFATQLRVIDGPAGPVAFGGVWRNVDDSVIGPLVAPDGQTAGALIADLAAATPGPLRLDLEDRHPELISWADSHGFDHGGTTAVMIHGADLPGDRGRLFAPLTVALG